MSRAPPVANEEVGVAYAFFWIPAATPQEAQQELNRFLRGHRVVALERQFVMGGPQPAWAIAVDYVEGEAGASQVGKGAQVDYREVLDAPTFAVFAALRTCRKHLAEQEGVPAYSVVTNEQLAEIARVLPGTMDELGKVNGVGEARLRKYGRALLDVVARSVQVAAPPGGSNEA